MIASLEPPRDGELLVVVGPTASGKTELAIELAERFGGEIVGADSVQIYRRFDVGSGKPTPEERARVPHHLVDALDPLDPIDAGRYATLADAAIEDVRARGKTPIVCGGTFLWVRALVRGLAEIAPASAELRAKHDAIARAEGRAALHDRLRAVDPVAAERIAPNDFVRTSRALEVFELTGKRLSDIHAAHGFRGERYPHRLLGVLHEKDELARRIAARTRKWLDSGWIEEVRQLLADGYRDARPMSSVGYAEVRDHVEGRLAREDLADAIDRATRIFTRRQRTWLRDEPVTWLRPGDR